MIHTLYVSATTEPEALQKEFRKKLMTGGAVVRLNEGLTETELTSIAERFFADAKRYNLSALVLEEISKVRSLPEALASQLERTNIPEILKALPRQ